MKDLLHADPIILEFINVLIDTAPSKLVECDRLLLNAAKFGLTLEEINHVMFMRQELQDQAIGRMND